MTRLASLDGRRVLVVIYGHVADTMAAVPGLRSLRRAYPRSRIEALVIEASGPVLRGCPYVDDVLTWRDFRLKGTRLARLEKSTSLGALGWRIRQRGYDAVLIFHRSFRAIRRLAAVSGAPVRAGVSDGRDGYTHWVPPLDGVHSSRDENRRVLEAIGVKEDGGPLELWTASQDQAEADRLLAGSGNGPLIGLHPGSDWSCQQWLPERFAAVGRALQAQIGARIVITGSASELALQEGIAAGLANPPVRAAGATSLGELVAVVRRLDLVICVNSAPAAIARAVGTRALVLMGPEDPRLTGLEPGSKLGIMQPGLRLAPGSWCEFGRWGVLSGCDSPMCRAISGLDQLEPADVAATALQLLRSKQLVGVN
ncbi:MAG: glycosyltransferase family 9 protein [Candidatus Dormibacteraceae bacterium]